MNRSMQQTNEPTGLLDVRTANDWMRSSRNRPFPKKLFGEMWFENELAILFADTAKGKSLLAVQIGESIARGRNIFDPVVGEINTRPQTVLYFDFELSDKQFEMRYAREHDATGGEFLKNHYRFSDRFRRVEISLNAALPEGCRTFDEFLLAEIERLVRRTKARIVVIDNITFLKRTNDGTRDAVSLIKRLHRLKKEYGLSILAIAHTARRGHDRPITAHDLQGSKVLANYADNMFAIGQSRLDAATRYIKHLKPRSSVDSSHVLSFRIARLKKNFLGFEYLGISTEAEHLEAGCYTADQEAIRKIKELSDEGMTIRAIAGELGLSRSKVHRLLHLWTADMDDEMDEYEGVVPAEFEPSQHPSYFPGIEEYTERLADPRYDGIYGREDAEAHSLRRESYLVEAARYRARKEYHRTGQAPPLDSDPAYSEFMKSEYSVSSVNSVVQFPATNPTTEHTETTEQMISGDFDSAFRTPHSAIESFALKRSTDGYGREIFVETEDPNGKPMVWYQYDSKGTKFRNERKGFGVIREAVDYRPSTINCSIKSHSDEQNNFVEKA
jgi:hypothetical protein